VNETTTSYIGLDIHKDSIAMAIAEAGRSAPRFIGTITPEPAALCKALTRCSKRSDTLIVYEAGPCGYGWARYLSSQGWRCEVISPAHITRKASEKLIKTDRLDALLLARESRAGNLVRVVVPDERDEAIPALARAREDASAARLRARLQLKAMLLRHGRAYHGKTSWTAAHERVERLTQALREQCEHWRMKGVVKALMCLRGSDLIAATVFIAEIGDLSRFAHPKALMKYLGLTPSEHSSGNTRRQGPITKAGNKHARRILVESAWTYRFNPRVSRVIEVRQQGQPKAIRDIAWRAQLRLAYRFRKLNAGRKMTQNKCCVAVARELAAFIWDIARQVQIPA
jgi:transposase